MKNLKRIVIVLILVCVFALAALLVGSLGNFLDRPAPDNPPESETPEPIPDDVPDEAPAEPPKDEELVILSRFSDLYAQNEDLVGWIRVPNTKINYPVVYCDDNAFYLSHDFLRKPAAAGTPFLDMDADIIENKQSLSLYAHYSTTFTALHDYKRLEYYQEYPLFEFFTLYDDSGIYKIFSMFYMAGNSSDKLFYYYPVSNFSNGEAFMKHVDEIRTRSLFDTTVEVNPDDELLLMTCCTYETDNLRFIVAGRKVRPGESIIVDTENASVNPEPLYPQKWYAAKGGSPPVLAEN